MLYEILITPGVPDDLSVTARVEADSWMGALKTGVQRLSLGIDIKHVVADLRDDGSVLVSEPTSGRTFVVRQALAAQPQIPKPPKAKPAPPPPLPPTPAAKLPPAAPTVRDRGQEERLVRAFHRATDAINSAHTPSDAANAFLEAALEIVPAEAGAVLFADITQQDMFIAFARGPATAALLNSRIPFGAGIAGHAVLYNIGLAVNDVTRDFRYVASLPEALGTRPVGMLCAPAESEGRTYGALHLVNKRGSARFDEGDMQVLTYLATRLAAFLDRHFMRVA